MQEIFSHPIPAVILMLGALIFVHELGHYVVGRLCGIAVEIFSIGFGPPLFSYKKGETQFRLCAIPLGGYVKFYGAARNEDVPFQALGREYFRASVSRRALTVAAGPVANFFFAVLVYFALASNGIQYPPAIVGEVLPNSRAEEAGLQSGDKVAKIDSIAVKTWPDIDKIIARSAEKSLIFTIERAGKEYALQVKPAATLVEDMLGKKSTIGRTGIGLAFSPPIITILNERAAIAHAGIRTGDTIAELRTSNNQAFTPRSFEDVIRILMKAKNDALSHVVIVTRSPRKEITLQLDTLPAPTSPRYRDYAKQLDIRDSQLTISSLTDPDVGDLKTHDVVLSIQGKGMENLYDLSDALMTNKQQTVQATISRGGHTFSTELKLKPLEVQRPAGVETVYTLPVSFLGSLVTPPMITEVYSNVFSAFAYGVTETAKQTTGMVYNLFQLVTGHIPLKSLGGPILIAKVAGDSAKAGLQTFLIAAALISINLGVVNLFPIPVLDGGQLLLLLFEKIKRKPLSEISIENFQKVGFVLIFSLVMLAMYNDLSRFWKSMVEALLGGFQ